jgi:pimeloyl-ACP methyl ester carboxylesterase
MPTITGRAAGVPFLAVPPISGARPAAPAIVAWHLLDAPRTEAAFAAAMPLDGLDAWRIYFGLPMTGSRMLAGGAPELFRLAAEDVALKVYGPIVDGAAAEFGPAYDELRAQLDLAGSPYGVLGGSIGGAVAQQVMATSGRPIRAAVLVSPVIQLRQAIEAGERQFGVGYTWSPEAEMLADRLDFVARASELRDVAVLVMVGENDDPGFREPAAELRTALGTERAELIAIAGMAHALAEEPGVEPAPQTPHAAVVDGHAVEWFRRFSSL